MKLVLLDSTFSKPTAALIEAVQTAVDPERNQGQGLGFAPIGHTVKVVGVTEQSVTIQTNLTYETGWDWESVQPYAQAAVDSYFEDLAQEWAEQENGLTVRISAIEMRLLECPGVEDVADTLLNGVAKNLTLDAESIPMRGELHGT